MKTHTVVSTVVNAPLEHAWNQLWRKAYETKDFMPILKQLTIHEKNDDEILRTMDLGQVIIKQRVVKDANSHTIYFHNLEGSGFQGLIYNTLYYNQHKQLLLEFGSDARSKAGDLMPPPEMFMGTLQRTKNIIESTK